MTSSTPKSVRWIRILLKIQLYSIFALIGITILLAIIQPTGGYTLDNGFFEDFGYGYISRMQGKPINSTFPVFLEDPGYLTGRMTVFAVFPALMLLALNNKKRKLFTLGTILLLLNGLANASPLGTISAIVILVLRVRKSAKLYFAS